MKKYVAYNIDSGWIYKTEQDLNNFDSMWFTNSAMGLGITFDETILPTMSGENISQLETFTITDYVTLTSAFTNSRYVVENSYINFLSGMWTQALTSNGILPASGVITVENTNELQNIGYIMALQTIDFPAYQANSNEFLKFKQTIVELGGDMSEVTWHS